MHIFFNIRVVLSLIYNILKTRKIPTFVQLKEFSIFLYKSLKNKKLLAPPEIAEERWKICQACPYLQPSRQKTTSEVWEHYFNKAKEQNIVIDEEKQKLLNEGLRKIKLKESRPGFVKPTNIIYSCTHCGCDMKEKVKYAESPCGDKQNPRWLPMSKIPKKTIIKIDFSSNEKE